MPIRQLPIQYTHPDGVDVNGGGGNSSSPQNDYVKSSDLANVAFTGDYNDLNDKPILGTAAAKDVPASGNASTTQVVKGDDTRLTDSRPASDVSAWAKASTKPSYTKSEIGLDKVDNFKAVSTEANQGLTSTEKENARANIGAGTSSFDGNYNNLTNKPTLGTSSALNVGVANGVASLDSNGKVPSSQLPSFVDDIIEGYYYNSKFYSNSNHTTEITGETGKIYVDLVSNKTYRYSGSGYTEISESLALGETSSTAYRGDRGKTAYDHSQVTSGNPHNVTASDVGLGNVGNFKAVSTVASQGLSSTEKSNAKANIGLDNVDNTSDATKKTNFKGSVAIGNTGFVTGGDVYNALNNNYKYIEITNNNYMDTNLFNDVRQGDVVHLEVVRLTNGVINIQRCNKCFIILNSISAAFKLRYGNYNMRILGNLRKDIIGYMIAYMMESNFYVLSDITEENALRFDDTKIKAFVGSGQKSRDYQEVYSTITFNNNNPITKLVIDITDEKDLLILNNVTMGRALYSFGDISYPSDTTKCSTFDGFFPDYVLYRTNNSSWEDLFVGCGFSLDNDYIINPSHRLYNLKKTFYHAYSYNSHITNVNLTTTIISNTDLTSCFESADGFNVILDGVDLTNNTCTDMFKDAKNITISAIGCNQDTIDKINANISGSYTSTITVITTDPNA